MTTPHITQEQSAILFPQSAGMFKLANELIDKANAQQDTDDDAAFLKRVNEAVAQFVAAAFKAYVEKESK
jgi:hypothetical protein